MYGCERTSIGLRQAIRVQVGKKKAVRKFNPFPQQVTGTSVQYYIELRTEIVLSFYGV